MFTQNEEDDDLVPVSGLSADTCFIVEDDMSLPCEHTEMSCCECEDVVDEEPEHVVVSPVAILWCLNETGTSWAV